jgi:Sec-independent protein translocase protein TatA
MELFGVGPLELALILILALVFIGPKDLVVYSQKLAQWIRKLTQTSEWKDVVKTTREIRKLPDDLMHESGLDVELRKLKVDAAELDRKHWEEDLKKMKNSSTAPSNQSTTTPAPENKIPPESSEAQDKPK